MIKKFSVLFAVMALAIATPVFAQEAVFRGLTAGAHIKAGAGGIAAEATTNVATSTAAAATINADSGTVTTESLTTAGLGTYTFVLTNSLITADTNKVFWSFSTASTGSPVQGSCVVSGAGHTATIKIYNAHASVAFNAIFKIAFTLVQ